MAWQTGGMKASGQFPAGNIGIALRDWRERRRVSQLELALRAGTTQRHVSFIEGGRSHPGRGMVVRLAESLDVPLRDRNALLLAAGYAPAYEEGGAELEAVRAALRGVLDGHLPYPAVVVDRHADLVDANAAFWQLTGASAPVNVARLFLGELAPRIVNFAEWGRHVLEGLRDERLDDLARELEPLVPPFTPGPDHVGFAVPLRLRTGDGELRLLTTLARFGTALDAAVAELRLEAFLPGDAETAATLSDSFKTATGAPPIIQA
jgi:transcriptional regulator with XRE-family HTH domain